MNDNEVTNKKRKLKILFFGTPDFAVESLKKIHEAGYEIVGVVTAPDKPAGRGKKIRQSDVKKYALENYLKILQPVNLKNTEFIEEIQKMKPDVAVVVAFRMLPEVVWKIPPLGTFNLHASLLPDYRGAAPIHHAIINGESQTGVTTFFINNKIDTGEIIEQKSMEISQSDTFGSMYEKLKKTGADLVLETLQKIESGQIKTYPQDHSKAIHPAPKLNKENTKIDWQKPAKKIYDFIRGLSPHPGAWTFYRIDNNPAKRMIIYQTDYEVKKHNLKPGETIIENQKIRIATPDGFILPVRLKPEGKKVMNVKDFLNGLRQEKNLQFEQS